MLKSILITKVLGSVTRHLISAGGAWLMAEGYADESTVATISGGAIALAGVGMSIFEKKFRF